MATTPEQRILELEQKVKLLEKKAECSGQIADRMYMKFLPFDVMFGLVEKG